MTSLRRKHRATGGDNGNLEVIVIKVKRIAFGNREHTKSRKSETRFD